MNVCVLMPVYNNTSGAMKTLQSLVAEYQTFDNFTVLIVDDGQNDGLSNEIEKRKFPFSVNILKNPRNSGIVVSLNNGLEYLKNQSFRGALARIDAGDECINSRLATQHSYLQQNPSIGMVGSYARYVTETGKFLYEFKPPSDSLALKSKMRANNYIMHPSVMIRFEILEEVGFYSNKYPHAEDLDLFTRLMQVTNISNIEIPLINYEVSNNQISDKYRRKQLISRARLQIRNFEFSEPECWKGIVKTVIGYLLPWSIVVKIKKGFN
jgi:glycosyltransferase involved in cell wall biosynthesis